MRTENLNYSLLTAIMFVVFFIAFSLLPSVSFGQPNGGGETGDLWFGKPGQIALKPMPDSLKVWSIESPDHQQYQYECRYEWWTKTDMGQVSGTFAYVDCGGMDTLNFDYPEYDSVYVRKYVHWQTASGARWARTKQYKVYNPCPTCK